MPKYIVIGTSMEIEEDTAEDAIERAQDQSGWHWEAIESKPGDPVEKFSLRMVEVTGYPSPNDGAPVIEVDTQEGLEEVRIYLNDHQLYAGNPEEDQA